MCGQYLFEYDKMMEQLFADLRQRLLGTPQADALLSGVMRPGAAAPALVGDSSALMRWGFRLPGDRLLINARSETAAAKPLFAQPLRSARCLLPAAHFFEWQRMGKEKVRYACSLEDGQRMYLAALYRFEPDAPLPVFVVLTRAAEGPMADIHDRMPVLVPQEHLPLWLHDDLAAPQLLTAPAPKLLLRAV